MGRNWPSGAYTKQKLAELRKGIDSGVLGKSRGRRRGRQQKASLRAGLRVPKVARAVVKESHGRAREKALDETIGAPPRISQ